MHDVIIIGAGPAGLSAALWCDELGLDTLVLEQGAEVGGQLLRVYNPVRNHLGVEAEDGRELRDLFAAQVERQGVRPVDARSRLRALTCARSACALRSGEELRSIAIIIATGVQAQASGRAGRGGVRGARRDWSRASATADGRGPRRAASSAAATRRPRTRLLLAEVCPTVTLVHRGEKLCARGREFVERMRGEHCITVFTERDAPAHHRRRAASRPSKSFARGAHQALPDGRRAACSCASASSRTRSLFQDQLARGRARLRRRRRASRRRASENVFAVGDVSNPLAPTVSGAVGAGATAAKVIASRLNKMC